MITKIYPQNPNEREVRKVANILADGGVAIIPTDTIYAFVAGKDHPKAVQQIAQLKGFSVKQARYSLLCDSLSQLSEHVRPLSRDTFALLKASLPGPFTFILDANNNVPRNYQNQNKSIGVRVPDNEICRAIIEAVGTPLVSTSVRRLNDETEVEYITDPELIHEVFGRDVTIVVDGGIGFDEPSTVVDCTSGQFDIIRQGKGMINS
ncbi:MAG: threonylcarbamoyl-AMP synthase [Bacteroidales bacterium]|nr:threonylcarbamoyl-AMP synthase [Candidatus Colimorpha onthohippi]